MKFDGFSSRETKRTAGRPRKKIPDFFASFRGKCCGAIDGFIFGYFARTTPVAIFLGFLAVAVVRGTSRQKKIKKTADRAWSFFKEMRDLSNAPSGVSGTLSVRA
jgi:hypothetical protein